MWTLISMIWCGIIQENHLSVIKEHRSLGKWIGVLRKIFRNMYYWIIPISGQPIAETTVQHITHDDMLDPYIAVSITALQWTLP